MLLKKGINFFDTADIYGEGALEKILGSQILGIRNKTFIMTKGGIINNQNKKNFKIKYIKKNFREFRKFKDELPRWISVT